MMRGPKEVAVAVRKADGTIDVDVQPVHSVQDRYPILKKPFLRGVVVLVESLIMGMKALSRSAQISGDEDEQMDDQDMALTIVVSVLLAVGLFIAIPTWSMRFLQHWTANSITLNLAEGLLRMAIFLAYIGAISSMKDIQRVFQYHGAEHKCINCVEHGHPLTVKYVRESSKEHKRCGTSFILIVMVISILMFMVIRVDTIWMRILSRIILVPVIAGISYEVLQCAGRSNSKFMDLVSRPGMWMQGLTTKEPDDSMIEVAIAATEAVFDWREYLTENFPGWEKQLEES